MHSLGPIHGDMAETERRMALRGQPINTDQSLEI
jgi:hypothetical protein